MNEEKVREVFKKFILECSENELNFIFENEVSIEEKTNTLLEKDIETQMNILDNFDIDYSK